LHPEIRASASTPTDFEPPMIDLRDSTDPEITAASRVLAQVDVAAREAGVEYLVVGATALTMLSVGLVGQTPPRATRDIDIAVAVDSWGHFGRLAEKLQKRGISPQSFLVDGVEVDVVPYGGVENQDRTILWPNDYRMSALLELLAWWERRMTTTRDAVDLGIMVSWYSAGDRFDQLFDENIDVLVLLAGSERPGVQGGGPGGAGWRRGRPGVRRGRSGRRARAPQPGRPRTSGRQPRSVGSSSRRSWVVGVRRGAEPAGLAGDHGVQISAGRSGRCRTTRPAAPQYHDAYDDGAHGDAHPAVFTRAVNLSSH